MSNRDCTSRVGTRRIASSSIVLADRIISGTIVVEAGRIASIDEGRLEPGAEQWGSDHLLPGLIELHTDHLEPHVSPRPNVFWDPLSAVLSYDAQIATAGITTVFDSLRVGRFDDRHSLGSDVHALATAIEMARAGGLLRVDHLTHLRCEICATDVLDETERFMAAHRVHLMSLMDHTPGVRQFRDESKFRDYYRGRSGMTEAELDTFIAERKQRYVNNHDRHRSALITMARRHGVMLASHDDTTADHVRESLADGVRLAEFPTTVGAAATSHHAGIAVMMGAPNVVRGGSHSGNVAARELAERGLLDVLSSDYVPASLLFGAVLLADVPSIGGLAGALRLVTKAPADAMGLDDRGELAVGKRADLVRADFSGSVPVVREVYCAGSRVA